MRYLPKGTKSLTCCFCGMNWFYRTPIGDKRAMGWFKAHGCVGQVAALAKEAPEFIQITVSNFKEFYASLSDEKKREFDRNLL